MKIKKQIRLERAVDKKINISKGGNYKQDRGANWFHKGVDIKANWGTKVCASEDGVVVCSVMAEGSVDKSNYGEVIVIDHVPEAGPKDRHIYTLYAHLDNRKVRVGTEEKPTTVTKGQIIGTTGNSGMRQSYIGKEKGIDKKDQGGFHLHFEVIDSPRVLTWGRYNFHGKRYRVNPEDKGGYVGSIITVEYEAYEEETARFDGPDDIRHRIKLASRW